MYRVGAIDDLAAGKSTFVVEMSEVAQILKRVTTHSLVLLDEVGRGTSTIDGLSITIAVAEYLASSSIKTIFATHYHELNTLANNFHNIHNYHITVKKVNDQILFNHQVKKGGTDQSFGIEVAQLAGLPKSLIERSKELRKSML